MKIRSLFLLLLIGSLFLFNSCDHSKEGLFDESAISALDKLSETVSALESCSYTLVTQSGNTESEIKTSDVYMRAPDKMHIYNTSETISKGFWYNGNALAIFDYRENMYDSIPAPATIIQVIDSVHNNYGVDFPASDFFYPTLTDDLINNFDTIAYVGNRTIDGVECKEINAINANLDVYILIEIATDLPKGLEIYRRNEPEAQSYIATFSNWKLNPKLPDVLFEFAPPTGSTKGSLLTLTSK